MGPYPVRGGEIQATKLQEGPTPLSVEELLERTVVDQFVLNTENHPARQS